ncbi:MAG: NAD(P)/FAD-dependent oxidoreductase [Chloroflexi bacterium]|nr:NAD(P)/FAD-dependent oxidoreductase [Chloroflexota bacterium]
MSTTIEPKAVDVLIIGAGPAGLAAAARLGEWGITSVRVLDRENEPGGLPAQCEHAGFGLGTYRQLMRGRAFADRLTQRAMRAGAQIQTGTTVLSFAQSGEVTAVSRDGLQAYRARTLVLATGCREQTRSGRLVGGDRPAGIYNLGVVQRLQTFMHALPGREAVIVGSDDMGLLAAHGLQRAGMRVKAVIERRAYRLGYLANEWFSLKAQGIPLMLNSEVTTVRGAGRVSAVEVQRRTVDGQTAGDPFTIACDTLIFCGEFQPENVLAQAAGLPLDAATRGPIVDQHLETEWPGIFACGNVLHAADAADHAVQDGERAAARVAHFLLHGPAEIVAKQTIEAGPGVRAVVPQRIRRFAGAADHAALAVRVSNPLRAARLTVTAGKQSHGRAFAVVAKPHRSVDVPVRIGAPDSQPLVVSARGWSI